MVRVLARSVSIALTLVVSIIGLQAGTVGSASADVVAGHEVTGAILSKYNSVGRLVVGKPIDDQFATAPRTGLDGVWQEFENGKIFSSADAGTHWVSNGPVLTRYFDDCGFFCFGLPTSDLIVHPNGTQTLKTQYGGNLYWSSAFGVRNITDDVLAKYIALKETKGLLGAPKTDVYTTSDGNGLGATFQWGKIVFSSSTGARELHGAIRWKWDSLGNVDSALGYPTSDEYAVAGGRQQNFEGGKITWIAATGKTKVTYI